MRKSLAESRSAIETKANAPKRVHELGYTPPLEPLFGAPSRCAEYEDCEESTWIAEVADDIIDSLSRTDIHMSGGEPRRRAMDDTEICTCGHYRDEHFLSSCDVEGCDCDDFELEEDNEE